MCLRSVSETSTARRNESRRAAARVLSSSVFRVVTCASANFRSLTAPDLFVRCEAAWGLAQLGAAARPAVGSLISVLRSDEAACLYKQIETPKEEEHPHLLETTPVFIAPPKGTSEAFCLSAIKALGEIGPAARVAVPELIRLRRTGNGTAQIMAAQALKQIDPANGAVA